MNRAERRAAARGRKGGSPVHISIHFGKRPEDFHNPVLEYYAKASDRSKMEERLRSMNVPGY